MKSDLDRHHRRSIRLRDYDYSRAGAYFFTICTHDREQWLGEIVEGQMHASSPGCIVENTWHSLPDRFPGIEIDGFVVMPNHVHGILVFVGAQFIAPEPRAAPTRPPPLGEIIRSFKAASTSLIRNGGDSGFGWQRNYYEHVIRNDGELRRIRAYVKDNPLNWDEDAENPAVVSNTRPSPEPGRPWAR